MIHSELLAGGAAAALIGVAIVAALRRQRRPPHRSFKCGRCGNAALHDERTSGAWRAGKQRFYCRACHATWLRSHPQASAPHRGASGCLGVVAALALMPLAGMVAWVIHRA
ncbi:hypothetical protein AR273_11530 [Stenotrophomonas maltophilia]|nr:hypothetical protein AR273_11530 [Stenotrophomonas maltophilia]